MPYSAWLLFCAVLGAAIGFSARGYDLEGLFLGGFFGLFAASFMHSKRRLRSPAAMGVLAVIGAVVILSFETGLVGRRPTDEAGFVWRDASVQARPLRTLKGVTLGQGMADVTARLGAFEPEASAPPQAGARDYVQAGSRLRLRVAGDKVTRVSYECAGNDDETRVNRIACWIYETRIVEVFGQGLRRLCGKAGPNAFAYDAFDTATRYVVVDGSVRGFTVMEPKDLEDSVEGDPAWKACG
jgi:hypothetical protein